MKRFVTTGALALSILAAPAAAQAATQTGTVLQANRSSHHIEVVDSRHVVHSYVVTGRVGKRVRSGSKVSFHARGKHASALRVTGRSRKVSFYAKVVASGSKNLTVKLGDGRRVHVSSSSKKKKHHAARHARAAGSIQLNIQGLQPGQTVLITQTDDGAGNVTITVKIVPNGDENGGEDQDATGTVTAVGGSSITLDVPGSGSMTFQADSDLLDGVSVGDQVDVTYYQDTDGTLVADDVEAAGDGSGDGSGDGTDSGSGDSTPPSGGDEQPSAPLTVLPPLGGEHRGQH